MKLYDELPLTVEYGGKEYKLRPAWPNVLAAIDALEDEQLSEEEQAACALDLLVSGPHPVSGGLLKAVFEALSGGKKEHSGPPVVDFTQDWELIYAGFWQAYGIDLFKRRDMHWVQFSALLNCLPTGTRLSDVVDIRQMEMPEPTKGNAKYRAKIAQLKTKYAIRGKQSSVQDGLSSLYETLKSMAKGGG